MRNLDFYVVCERLFGGAGLQSITFEHVRILRVSGIFVKKFPEKPHPESLH